MLSQAKNVYVATKKKNDLFFNVYVMRPFAAAWVAALVQTRVTPNQVTLFNLVLFKLGALLLIALPTTQGALLAVAILELSYCFDCVDGMLARYKKIASKEGHLFDFFTDELKAIMLAAAIPIRLWRTGGIGLDGSVWEPKDARFLLAATAGAMVIASATSLTNFIRRPELSGKETTIEAHYETVVASRPTGLIGWTKHGIMSGLRLIAHYPSHIWLFAAFGRLDVMIWLYLVINAAYLARGWLGLFVRFGRPAR